RSNSTFKSNFKDTGPRSGHRGENYFEVKGLSAMKKWALFLVIFLAMQPGLGQKPEKSRGSPPPSGLPMARPEEVGMSADRLSRIRIAMQRYVDRGEVPGVVTLVARRGRVVHFDAVGYRDAESRAPMPTDAIFRIASMTKPITSVALMMLYEQGYF